MAILVGKETNITADLDEVEKQLGVDLKLTKDGDLEISNLGDVKLIAGAQNAAQALFIKFNIEPGGLIYHPTIGTSLNIGEKLTNAVQIKTQILKSLAQDDRFQNPRVNVTVLGNTVIINLRVVLANTGKAVPLQFAVTF